MKESKAMAKKEISFMQKKGAPKSMIKHEKAEYGMKKGGNTSRMNRLEELGRVDAEKARTPKGKANLFAEKKRIVGEMKMASGGTTSNRVVSKKELEESGLSLRDFLNKEKGLTRKPPEGIKREYRPRDAADQEIKKAISAEAGMSRGTRNFAGAGRGESGGASADALARFNAGKEGYDEAGNAMKRGGKVKKMASGGSASARADGVAQRGKTKGKFLARGGKL
jgi:hypothetical protein